MITQIYTIAFEGIQPIMIDVQAHIIPAKFIFNIVGLPDKTLSESKERIRVVFEALGLSLPIARITVNLSPADMNKAGSHYDLPIMVALLTHMGILDATQMANYIIMGELSLDGRVCPVPGVLPAAIAANEVQKGIICPKLNGSEARWAGDLPILAPGHMLELINHLKGFKLLEPPSLPSTIHTSTHHTLPDFQDIKGQQTAKRGLEIAAAGGHNVLMIGPPGSGKSMLASRLPSILPPLTSKELLEVSMIASITGQLSKGQLKQAPPFRSPHHSCSMAAMVGGGRNALPGEITLAHKGVLFLDELPEFPKNVLESLRQPLEAANITVARANAHICYPADIQLIAAMNPCKCGYLADITRCCNKAPLCAKDYQTKLSGPLLDRIDIHLDVAAVTPHDLQHYATPGETSTLIRERIIKARDIQAIRYKDELFSLNNRVDGTLLRQVAALDKKAQNLLDQAFHQLKLSMRSYHRILRVARTIADLRTSEQVELADIAESLSYRGYNDTQKMT